MFIAMNRFKITKGFEAGFEEVWRQRDSYLHTVEGFKSFSLLKGGDAVNLFSRAQLDENRIVR